MYIITHSNNNYLAMEISETLEILKNDIILNNLEDDKLYIGIENNINYLNYCNLLHFTKSSFKNLYLEFNPNKKFMEQKKNKNRRLKSIYNLLKQIIKSDKYELNKKILQKQSLINHNINSKKNLDSDSIQLDDTGDADNDTVDVDNDTDNTTDADNDTDNTTDADNDTDNTTDADNDTDNTADADTEDADNTADTGVVDNNTEDVVNDSGNINDKLVNKRNNNVVVFTNIGFMVYSTIVFFAGLSFNHYFPDFKFNFIKDAKI
jgi:hypothetical protein